LVSKHKKGKQEEEEERTARKIKEDWKGWKDLSPHLEEMRIEILQQVSPPVYLQTIWLSLKILQIGAERFSG
jgi:hypothetical protein